MNHLIKIVWIWVLVFNGPEVCSQVSQTVLEYTDFLTIVKENHPLAFQARLKEREGELTIQKARGAFDPKAQGNINQKYFKDKQYYSHVHGGLKIPTWFGMEVFGGYDNNGGQFLNPEEFTSNEDLWSLGLSINVGNGLFIDQRRADLKQAKIYANSTLLEQRLMLNDLFYKASWAYFDWVKASYKTQVYLNAVNNAEERLEGIKNSASTGEIAKIDTLKATIQVQDRRIKWERAKMELKNKKFQLETFLWEQGFIPLELDSLVEPPAMIDLLGKKPNAISVQNLNTLVENHPEIIIKQNGIDMNRIDYRLKREAIKPNLELKYNALGDSDVINQPNLYSINNYTWGATLSYSLFTRKERASARLSELKIESKEAEILDKKAAVQYYISQSLNTVNNIGGQLSIQEDMVDNYQGLLNSEIELFNIGESSIFLVNRRDQDYIDSQVKLIDLLYSKEMAEAEYLYHIVGY